MFTPIHTRKKKPRFSAYC